MKLTRLYKNIFLVLLLSFFTTIAPSQNKKTFTLVIDAGHGGHDSGTTGNRKYKRYEKDVALSIALKLGSLVEKNMKDVKVVYTRKTDVFITLKNRPKIANDNNADLFMSIHCNANKNKSANGTETYVLGTHKNKANFEVAKKENSVIYLEKDYSVNYEGFDPNSLSSIVGLTLGQEQYLENSLLLASLIQNNFKKNTALKSRGFNGVKQAGFWVLARNYMPSVLVETGFLSNDKDAKYLMSDYGQGRVANALYLGFKEYKKYWDEQRGIGVGFEQEVSEETNDKIVEPAVKPVVKKPVAKKPVAKKPIKEPVKADKTKNVDKYEYAIQLFSTGRKLPVNSKEFKGLSKVSSYKNGKVYGYVYNKQSNYKEAIFSQKIVKKKGFKGAFVVAFRNGKRVAVKVALKEDSNN